MTIETFYGKITASKETLNWLSLIIGEASKGYAARNREALADRAMEVSDKIYNELDAVGYYDGADE